MVKLPLDTELVEPESLLEWIHDTDVELCIDTIDEYPKHPLHFSEYHYEPPRIRVIRYKPMDDWFNTVSQQQVGFYGPWYYLFIAYRFYFHLEMHGLYEIKRAWHHTLLGKMTTLEERAFHFAATILETRHPVQRFESFVERSFRPGR